MQHRDRYHTVHRGETLSIIARRYGVSEGELVALNHLRSRHRIRVGQVLTLPGDRRADRGGAPAASRTTALHGPPRRQPVDHRASLRRVGGGAGARQRAGEPPPHPGGPAPGHPGRGAGGGGLRGARPSLPAAQPAAFPSPRDRSRAAARDRGWAPEAPPAPAVAAAWSRARRAVEPARPSAEPDRSGHRARAAKPDAPSKGEPAVEPDPALEAGRPAPTPTPTRARGRRDRRGARAERRARARDRARVDARDRSGGPCPSPSRSRSCPRKRPAGPPDPSDYTVHGDRVTVQADETLGHYAEWLEVSASRLRQANRMRYGQPLVIGRRVRLDFSRVTPEEFERRRLEYHRTLQDEFFSAFEVTGHRAARAQARRDAVVPGRAQVPDPDLAAAPVQPGAGLSGACRGARRWWCRWCRAGWRRLRGGARSDQRARRVRDAILRGGVAGAVALRRVSPVLTPLASLAARRPSGRLARSSAELRPHRSGVLRRQPHRARRSSHNAPIRVVA